MCSAGVLDRCEFHGTCFDTRADIEQAYSTYTDDWHLASFRAITAYSIDNKVFSLPIMPPAPLGTRGENDLDRVKVVRLVATLYKYYDDLQVGSLSWAYWHALCAPLHIAPVHFGAAIEALQRRYVALHPAEFASKVITDKGQWLAFAASIEAKIAKLSVSDEAKAIMRSNIGLLNGVPRRVTTDELLKRTGIVLGKDDAGAWKRRHHAAHGNDIEPGSYPGMIRDVKLLKVLFHRMLLKIVDGADKYYDYTSLNFPIRVLSEAAPSVADEQPGPVTG